MLKRTKIVATVGPASGSPDTLRSMMLAGVDVFRINFSHGDDQQREQFLADIRVVESELRRPVAVCGDLCGPKIRVGMIQDEKVRLVTGQEIVIQRNPVEGTAQRISTTLAELVDVVQPGEKVLLADGRLCFEVLRTAPPAEFTCRVVVGGMLGSGKGVNLPDSDLPLSALTEKDRQDIRWIGQRDFDYVALSFVQRPQDIDELRDLLRESGSQAHIIAKIEKPRALQHLDAIIDTADAVMVARGDLGVEMDFPQVPVAQKTIARKCQLAGKPCIIATEMLESMIRSPRPTRAEVSDVANAVLDHADAVMLSAESSIGQYPVQAVDAMRRVVLAAEGIDDQLGDREGVTVSGPRTTAALAASVRKIMQMQDIAAISVFTVTGTTARVMAKNRPACAVLSLSSQTAVTRRVCLYYGVIPQLVQQPENVEQQLRQSQETARQLAVAVPGDHIIVLAGHPVEEPGSTKGLIVEHVA